MTDTMTTQNINLSSWDTLYNTKIHVTFSHVRVTRRQGSILSFGGETLTAKSRR
jgi:hypothetical protein